MCIWGLSFKEQKARGGCPPPYTLGQFPVNDEVGVSELHTCFEGCLEADFIVITAEPNRELLLIAQQVGSVEQVAEVGCNDTARSSQSGNCDDLDVRAGINDFTIGKSSQVNLVVHDSLVGFEGHDQQAESVPTAEHDEVGLGQDSLRNASVDGIKDLDNVAGSNRTADSIRVT